MSPGQQHGRKEVSSPHKHSIHSGDVHADFLSALGPIWFHYSGDTQNNHFKTPLSFCFHKVQALSEERRLDTYSLAPKRHQELVSLFGGQVCTCEDDSLWTHLMKQVHHLGKIGEVAFHLHCCECKLDAAQWKIHETLTLRASSSELIFLPVNNLHENRQEIRLFQYQS